MAVIHSTYKLLKIFSCFIFFQPPAACLAQFNSNKNTIVELNKDRDNTHDSDLQKLTVKIKTVLQFCQTTLHQSRIPIQCISLFCQPLPAQGLVIYNEVRERLKDRENMKTEINDTKCQVIGCNHLLPSNLIHTYDIWVPNKFHC